MRKQLRKKEIRGLNLELNQRYGLDNFLSKKGKVEWDNNLLFVDEEATFFYHENKLVPTLRLVLKENVLKKIIVDTGAVKFVASGADVMRPGVVSADDGIKQDDIVAVVEQAHGKALAIGKALYNSEELMKLASGKVVKTIHFIGDEVWKAS